MLIDHSYFTHGPRKIHNATLGESPDPAVREVKNVITGYIRMYEPAFIEDMFGLENADAINKYMVKRHDPKFEEIPDMEVLLQKLKEPCADYVYWHMLADTPAVLTLTGFIEQTGADPHAPVLLKQVSIWNDMVSHNRLIHLWLHDKCSLKGMCVRKQMLEKANRFNL